MRLCLLSCGPKIVQADNGFGMDLTQKDRVKNVYYVHAYPVSLVYFIFFYFLFGFVR